MGGFDLLGSFCFRLDRLKLRTKSSQEVFKSLEELNNYRTNLALQVFSLSTITSK